VRGGQTGAASALAAVLASCGIDSAQERAGSDRDAPRELPPLAHELKIAQWPLYIDKKTVPRFEQESGIDVTYKEVINDNQEFYGTISEPLAAGKETGWDLIALSDWVVSKMNRAGWLESLDHSLLPSVTSNLGDAFRDPPYDPGNAHSVPWQGGITGIAYNTEFVDSEPTRFEDLWDPSLRGHVGMLTEMVDTMNLTLLTLGVDPQEATVADAARAQERLLEQRDMGIVRGYYGNDYINGLARGDLWASMAWSGDIFWLSQDRPEVRFVVPEEGGILWTTPLEMPKGAQHPRDAHAFLDFVYQPQIAANITEWVGYITPVPKVKGILLERARAADKADASFLRGLAESPLVFPSPEIEAKLHSYKVLSTDEEREWNELFQQVIQG
jgi:spermidine/putrescine transport system substrate-binding protein